MVGLIRYLLFCAAFVSLVALEAWAEEMGIEEYERAEMFLLGEEPMVISAAKHPQSIEQAPSSIEVITREEIDASGYNTLGDFLRLAPGIIVRALIPGIYYVNNRGYSGPGTSLCLSLLMVDGRPSNDMILLLPLTEDLPLSLEDIERIEVIRGPSSVLYGSGAMTGLFNVITRQPPEKDGEHTVTGKIVGGGVLGQEKDVWGPALSAQARGSGRMGATGYSVSGEYREEADWFTGDSGAHKVGKTRGKFSHSFDKFGTGSLEGGISVSEGRLFFGYFQIPYERIDHYLKGDYSFKGASFQISWEREYFESLDIIIPLYSNLVLKSGEIPFEANNISSSLDYSAEFPAYNRITVGMTGDISNFSSQMIHKEWEGRRLNRELHWSGFLQDEYSPIDKLVFTGGIRNDQYTITRQAWSWRGAVVYLPWKNHSFRGTVGRGFRKPSFFEGQLLVNYSGIKDKTTQALLELLFEEGKLFGNPDLLNDEIISYEIGYLGRYRDVLRYSLTLFHDELENSIEFIFEANAPSKKSKATYFNIPRDTRVFANGGELALDLYPSRYLHGILSYTYVHNFAPEKYPYWNTERHIVTLGAIAQFAGIGVLNNDDLSIGTFGHYLIHERPSVMNPTVPVGENNWKYVDVTGHLLLSIKAGYTFWKNIEAGISAYNIVGDKEFREYGGFTQGDKNYAAEVLPIKLMAFLSAKF